MTFPDLLSFISIVVSIVFGFILTRFSTIRDARTRVVKDYYIEQVKTEKKKIDAFFHKIAFGNSSFRRVINWYNHIIIDVKDIDQSVRKSLDLQIGELSHLVDLFYGEITNWDDYNDQYSSERYEPSAAHKQRLFQMKSQIDDFLNAYVCHINQANNYPIWKIQINRIKQSKSFYKEQGKLFPFMSAIWERVEKHFFELSFAVALLFLGTHLYNRIEWKMKHDLLQPIENISAKQDSIYKVMSLFKDKYKPVEVKNKTFNNSSFFSADKIDSVQIKLFQKVSESQLSPTSTAGN